MPDDLIKRLEAASEGSRDLDRAIFDKVEWLQYPEDEPALEDEIPHYTRSLDAALGLIPKGWFWSVGHAPTEEWALCYPPGTVPGYEGTIRSIAATSALALSAAALKAREPRNV